MAAELARLAEAKGRRGLVRVEVSAGEYLDRLSIARLKAERIADPSKRPSILAELEALERAGTGLPLDAEAAGLAARLAEVNGRLWDPGGNSPRTTPARMSAQTRICLVGGGPVTVDESDILRLYTIVWIPTL
jgi:hypothetical protein